MLREFPLSTQIQGMEASNFIGNQLYGPSITKDCRTGHETIPSTEQVGEKHEDEYGFRLSIAVGFVVGVLGIISPLLLYRTWKIINVRDQFLFFKSENIFYRK